MKTEIKRLFEVKDMGEIKWFLQLHISRDREKKTFSISQEQYIESILSRFGMTEASDKETPMVCNILYDENSRLKPGEKPYREAIGALLYLMLNTRPDLAYSVGYLSRYMDKPTKQHWEIVKRIFRYLKETKTLKLMVNGNGNNSTLTGYSDSDWAGDKDDCKSTTGFVFFAFGALVSWKSVKQRSVALSSTEAEYMALTETFKEGIWINNLLNQIGIETKPFIVYEDNKGALESCKNTSNHGRMKHINLRYHFNRELVQQGIVKLKQCGTDKMIADILTKPLGASRFKYLRDKLQIV